MSSKETLERILAKDNIGDLYRTYAVSKRLIGGSLILGLGADLIYLGAYGMTVETDLNFGNGLFCALLMSTGIAPGFYGIRNLYNGIKATKGYLGGKINEDNFNYLDGKISHRETGVERVFGRVVYPVDSLDELEGKGDEDEKKCPYKFIDNIILKNHQHDKYTQINVNEQSGDYEDSGISTYVGEFIIQRGKEERKFNYQYRAGASEFDKLYKAKNKEIALIFSNFSGEYSEDRHSFIPIKVYNPHP